jgi:hypothetical protein
MGFLENLKENVRQEYQKKYYPEKNNTPEAHNQTSSVKSTLSSGSKLSILRKMADEHHIQVQKGIVESKSQKPLEPATEFSPSKMAQIPAEDIVQSIRAELQQVYSSLSKIEESLSKLEK